MWRAKTPQNINCASLFLYWLAFHLRGETEGSFKPTFKVKSIYQIAP